MYHKCSHKKRLIPIECLDNQYKSSIRKHNTETDVSYASVVMLEKSYTKPSGILILKSEESNETNIKENTNKIIMLDNNCNQSKISQCVKVKIIKPELFKWCNCRFPCGCNLYYQNTNYKFNVGSTFNLYAFLSRFD